MMGLLKRLRLWYDLAVITHPPDQFLRNYENILNKFDQSDPNDKYISLYKPETHWIAKQQLSCGRYDFIHGRKTNDRERTNWETLQEFSKTFIDVFDRESGQRIQSIEWVPDHTWHCRVKYRGAPFAVAEFLNDDFYPDPMVCTRFIHFVYFQERQAADHVMTLSSNGLKPGFLRKELVNVWIYSGMDTYLHPLIRYMPRTKANPITNKVVIDFDDH